MKVYCNPVVLVKSFSDVIHTSGYDNEWDDPLVLKSEVGGLENQILLNNKEN